MEQKNQGDFDAVTVLCLIFPLPKSPLMMFPFVGHFMLSIMQGGMNSFCSTLDAERVTPRSYDSSFCGSSKQFIKVVPAPYFSSNWRKTPISSCKRKVQRRRIVLHFLCLCKEINKESTAVPITIGIDAVHFLCRILFSPKSAF